MTRDEVRRTISVMKRCIAARKDVDSMDWAKGRIAVESLAWMENDPVLIGDVSMELFGGESTDRGQIQ